MVGCCEEVSEVTGKVCSGDCGQSLFEDAQMKLILALDWKSTDTDSKCFDAIMALVYKGETVEVKFVEDSKPYSGSLIFTEIKKT